MSDDFFIKAERFLDIVSDITQGTIDEKKDSFPIQFHQNGATIFSSELIQELSKPENKDLLDWAYQNAKDLF